MKLKKHYLGHLSQKKISISYFFFLSSLLSISHLMFTPHPIYIYILPLFLSHLLPLSLSLSSITKISNTLQPLLFSVGFQSLPLTLIFPFSIFHGGSSSPSPSPATTTTTSSSTTTSTTTASSPPSSQHHN